MSEQSRVMTASLAGAAIGALVGYLYMTEQGRRFRSRLEPGLDEVIREVRRLRSSLDKAKTAATEGWRALGELSGESGRPSDWRGPMKQSSPF